MTMIMISVMHVYQMVPHGLGWVLQKLQRYAGFHTKHWLSDSCVGGNASLIRTKRKTIGLSRQEGCSKSCNHSCNERELKSIPACTKHQTLWWRCYNSRRPSTSGSTWVSHVQECEAVCVGVGYCHDKYCQLKWQLKILEFVTHTHDFTDSAFDEKKKIFWAVVENVMLWLNIMLLLAAMISDRM